jgi:hypothetical protein
MIKLSNILNELKISNPNKTFRVTPEGKIMSETFSKFQYLAKELGLQDEIYEIENEKVWALIQFSMLSDVEGESIIFFNENNNVDDVVEKYIETIGGNKQEVFNILKQLLKFRLITPIKL